MSKMRLAVIGAGPAGIYASDLLIKAERDFDVSIDLFDLLPAPYGLVRYGVAPDHPRIKGIITALKEVLDRGDIRYFGNVQFGRDLSLDDLKKHYHAVIFATGAVRDAELDIPGIDAKGSYGAADFVSWFDGHPDVPRTWPLEAEQVAVVGAGNVALDVSRMLVKHADDLLPTEIPDNVYQVLKQNPIRELHLFARRGPAYVKFTPLELRELGEVRDVDMVLDERDFQVEDPFGAELASTNKQVVVMQRVFNAWREEQKQREELLERHPGDAEVSSRKLHIHFWSKPVEVLTEDGRVSGIRVQRTKPDGQGGVIDTDEFMDVPAQALYRAVGYFGSPLPGVPFDERLGVIPNDGGRVLDAAGNRIPGIYATGWIKRGPVGLIGHTKSDAMETLEGLLADQETWWQPEHPDEAAVTELLDQRGVEYTTVEGWQQLDDYEQRLGQAQGRERIKVVPRDEMTAIARSL